MTSSEVAAASGVSRTTVSYVLNGTPKSRISEETRLRVLEVAESLGHIPNAAARRLRAGKSWAVVALIPNSHRSYVVDTILQQLDRRLSEHGYTLITRRYDPSTPSLDSIRATFNPDLTFTLSGIQVPADEQDTSFIDTIHMTDYRAGGRLAAEYLLSKGHRRFAYLFPHDDAQVAAVAAQRWEGFIETLAGAGISAPERFTINPRRLDFTPLIESLRDRDTRPSVVMCHNDEMAANLITALSFEGLTVPHDIAVMGHDDHPVSRLGITTVGFDIQAFGEALSARLIAALEGYEATPSTPAPLRLVPRASA